jgi:hypothetical protein
MSDTGSFPPSNPAPSNCSDDMPSSSVIPPAYRQKMRPVCDALIDNADRLGRLVHHHSPLSNAMSHPSSGGSSEMGWRKDPAFLTDAELESECRTLEALLLRKTTANRQARAELDILDPAVRRYDLEKQFVYIELMNEETGLFSPSQWTQRDSPA